jgi:hypothetical protein
MVEVDGRRPDQGYAFLNALSYLDNKKMGHFPIPSHPQINHDQPSIFQLNMVSPVQQKQYWG